jgi:hypothetical protein
MDQVTVENTNQVVIEVTETLSFDLDLHLDAILGESRSSHA